MPAKWFQVTGVLAALILSANTSAAETEFTFESAQSLMETHCNYCHGANEPAAGLNLETLSDRSSLYDDIKTWLLIQQRVNAGEMPPKNALPLDTDDHEAYLTWLKDALIESACGDGVDPGPTPIRRLNRTQYAATIRDLIGVHFNAGHDLPADGAGGEGFDNAAETLFLSPVHAERYLEAAREVLDYAAKDGDARQRLLAAVPDERTSARQAARITLERFAERAFRRPVDSHEIDRFEALYHIAAERGETYESAVFYAMQAVLISPHFLFLVEEPNRTDRMKRINDYELASRLSYFLWSSMPDRELLDLAEAGVLHHQDVLKQQIERMLSEPLFEHMKRRERNNFEDMKSHEFAVSFISQWLGTRELGLDIRPDRERFKGYNDILETAMRYEPVVFFQRLLTEDLSLLNLIDSDFTYASHSLARHYELEDHLEVKNQQLNFLKLPRNSLRGGVLTMAGPLAVSSLPHRTSPVLRGKWVLETLLGAPPPPAPPNVPELPENEEHTQPRTVRERLDQHRENPACASCHDRIDPIGFGLENFDVTGRWRDKDAGQPIDASGVLPNGQTFEGAEELKEILMERKDDVMRHLASKMLSYALGRGLVIEDHCTIERIVEQLKANDYSAQTLIYEIVSSVPFRYHQANEPVDDTTDTASADPSLIPTR